MKRFILLVLFCTVVLSACSSNEKHVDDTENSTEAITPDYDNMFDDDDDDDDVIVNLPVLHGGYALDVDEFIDKPLSNLTSGGIIISGRNEYDNIHEFSAYDPNTNVVFHFTLDCDMKEVLDGAEQWDSDEEMLSKYLITSIRAKYYDNSELDAYEGCTVRTLVKNGFNIIDYVYDEDKYILHANIGDIGDVTITLEKSDKNIPNNILSDEDKEKVFAEYKVNSINYDLILTSFRGYR